MCESHEDFGEGTSSSGVSDEQHLKQSFDRFDDSLAENLLSYLTFNEKVMFESVSKQWKNCIYNKQTELSLYRWDNEDTDTLNRIQEPLEVVDYTTGSAVAIGLKRINKIWLKSLLKKCKSIEKVHLDCFLDFEDLDIIGRNCPQLRTLEFETTGLNESDFKHFGERYGHQLEKVWLLWVMFSAKYWTQFLMNCKNLKEISSPHIADIMIGDSNYLPKIECVENYQLYHGGHVDIYVNFCVKFNKTLKKLCVSSFFNMNEKEMDSFFASTSKLMAINDLDIYCQAEDNQETINKYLDYLSVNSQLKKLGLTIHSGQLKVNQLFYSFEKFKSLVKLDVCVNTQNDSNVYEGSVKCLQSSKGLKYLRISIENIGEEFFDDIHKYLPNLSVLIIECETEITDKTIFQLKYLKRLKRFNLNRFRDSNKYITDDSVCSVINSCPALEFMYFASRPNITNKTIATLIDCANRLPKKRLVFECVTGDENQFQALDLLSFVDQIPLNLTVNILMNNDNEE